MSEVRMRKRLAWSIGVVVVLAATGTGFWLAGDDVDDGPGEVVNSYLAAVRAGDVAAALSLTGWTPDEEYGAFLTAEAVSADWTVDRVAEVDNDGVTARVEVTLESPVTDEATGVFELIADDGSWRLDMPFAEIGFGDIGVDYVEVNGQYEAMTKHSAFQRYLLFPGLHHFYTAENPSVDISAEPRLLLPGGDLTRIDAQIAVSESGVETAQQAVDDYIDECADTDEVYVANCPFSAQATSLDDLLDIEYMNEVRDADWTVEEYPVIDVAYANGRFEVTDVEPGEVGLSATGTERVWDSGKREFYDGDDIDFAIDCRIEARWLEPTVGADGAWTIHHFADFEDEYDWRPGSVMETCGSAAAW